MSNQLFIQGNLHFERTESGIEYVRRTEGELPFAELHPPKLTDIRKWGIKYRQGDKPNTPFGDTYNVCPMTRENVLFELERVARVCSDYQLGLGPFIPKK